MGLPEYVGFPPSKEWITCLLQVSSLVPYGSLVPTGLGQRTVDQRQKRSLLIYRYQQEDIQVVW